MFIYLVATIQIDVEHTRKISFIHGKGIPFNLWILKSPYAYIENFIKCPYWTHTIQQNI